MDESGHSYRFPKKEKLVGKKSIEELFKNGSSFYFHPLLVKFLPETDSQISYNRLLFTVPKRNFKRAVDRNLLKRRMREAYRLNKALLLNESSPSRFYKVAFVYTDKSSLPYTEIESKLKLALIRLHG